MSVRVLRPGLLTTVQDLGRPGWQSLGVVPGGAMDPVSHTVANALVGNAAGAATLECTVLGPELVFGEDSLVAVYGADFDAQVAQRPFPMNRPVLVSEGTRLALRAARRGARAYLAIAGGFDVPEVMGSRSTYLPAAFGGLEGRALRPGDLLGCVPAHAQLSAERFERLARKRALSSGSVHTVKWSAPALTLHDDSPLRLRLLEGRHTEQFDGASRRALYARPYRVAPASDRMGFRMEGAVLSRSAPVEILSEPTCLGSVQVPPDGAPIVLMADHQTTGGYPKIGEVALADIAPLAQRAPGGWVQFAICTQDEARSARRAARRRQDGVLDAIEKEHGV